MIERYYRDLVHCLNNAATYCIPVFKSVVQKHWWTPELDELKHKCIIAAHTWKCFGRLRSGDVNTNRVRCKMKYKNAIKDATSSANIMFNDRRFDYLFKKDNTSFWKTWRKKLCTQNLKAASTLNANSGDDSVRAEFTKYYASIFQPNFTNANIHDKTETLDFLKQAPDNYASPFIDLHTVQNCVLNLKNNKASGHDGIYNEHIKMQAMTF